MRKKDFKPEPNEAEESSKKAQTIRRKLTAEDSYFAQRDQEIIERNARERKKKEEEEEESKKQSEDNKPKKIKLCFECDVELQEVAVKKIIVDKCPKCGGVWLSHDDIDSIFKKEDSIFNAITNLFVPKEK